MSSVRLNLEAYYLVWQKCELEISQQKTSIGVARPGLFLPLIFSCWFVQMYRFYYHPKLILQRSVEFAWWCIQELLRHLNCSKPNNSKRD